MKMQAFQEGKTQIIMQFSAINNAWLVWRQDGENQGNVRVHNDKEDARADFDNRVEFLTLITEGNS